MEASFSASIQQLCFIVYVAYKRGKALRNSSDPTDDDEHAKYELRRIPLPRTPLHKGRAEDGRPDGACIMCSVDDQASLCFIAH